MNVYPSWISEFQTGIYPDWLYAYASGLSVQLDVFFALLSPTLSRLWPRLRHS